MTLVTYRGDEVTTWRGREFVPGQAVALDPVDNAEMIAKARFMPDFVVDEALKADTAPSLDDLRAQAESLGVAVDGRWKAEKLQAAIDEALEA